ncbi:MAG: Crp/Fnr family transcriptional regulator [Flavipsychrobacter sp.]|jgi:CRP/FNR family transcriptional regulator|nr:Crp/Fnr family transcriptional regulator [Flavipsychrobacter sp.]
MHSAIFSDPHLNDELKKYARAKKVSKDTVLIQPGDEIVFLPIVQKGVLRIMRQDNEGREIFLYHLYPGQTCAMAINCCQSHKKSMVKAVAEDDSEILQVPVKLIDEWFKYEEWKSYINNTYANRFAELMQVIDLIAFSNMDKQVLHYLEERAKAADSKALYITHQQIADELHTHREAISRLLRTMEQKGMVRLGRNTIELLTT